VAAKLARSLYFKTFDPLQHTAVLSLVTLGAD